MKLQPHLILLLVCFTAFSSVSSSAQRRTVHRVLTAREIAQSTLPSVVVLVTEDKYGEPFALGTGFFVNDGLIATNYHVVKDAGAIYAKAIGQSDIYQAFTIRTDEAEDLALLRSGGHRTPGLPLGDSRQVAVGDTVYVIGNPEGLEGTFSQGIISGLRGNLLQIT